MSMPPDENFFSNDNYPPGVTEQDIDRDFNTIDGDDDAADELRYAKADSDQEGCGR